MPLGAASRRDYPGRRPHRLSSGDSPVHFKWEYGLKQGRVLAGAPGSLHGAKKFGWFRARLFYGDLVADFVVGGLRENVPADQFMFVLVRAAGDDFVRVAAGDAGKHEQVVLTGGI
jgi:hypothetical protein